MSFIHFIFTRGELLEFDRYDFIVLNTQSIDITGKNGKYDKFNLHNNVK